MAQFDVYPHPIEELRSIYPFVVQVQSDFLRAPEARITLPLTTPSVEAPPMSRLNPKINLSDTVFILDTLHIVAYEPSDLRRPIANLRDQADVIWDALDYALHGY